MWFKALGELGNTAENLKAAAEGENYEWTDMYAGFAKDAEDFEARLLRLTDDEFSKIIAMIREGLESIGCLPVECAEILISETMKRKDMAAANELYALYEMGGGCG